MLDRDAVSVMGENERQPARLSVSRVVAEGSTVCRCQECCGDVGRRL